MEKIAFVFVTGVIASREHVSYRHYVDFTFKPFKRISGTRRGKVMKTLVLRVHAHLTETWPYEMIKIKPGKNMHAIILGDKMKNEKKFTSI